MTPEFKMLSDQDMNDIKEAQALGQAFMDKLEALGGNTRELALAKTKIEEAVMWTVKHITK